ncbi:MAG: hypothetical protein ACFCBW_10060 [Candidatus Competibacterales bacterium]
MAIPPPSSVPRAPGRRGWALILPALVPLGALVGQGLGSVFELVLQCIRLWRQAAHERRQGRRHRELLARLGRIEAQLGAAPPPAEPEGEGMEPPRDNPAFNGIKQPGDSEALRRLPLPDYARERRPPRI